MQLNLLTLLPADTHASPSVSPGSEAARKMTVTSGRKCIGSWLPLGPVGSLLKTLLGTSAWASTKCFLTWRAKATPAGRLYFQLAPSMPRTEGTESGLWPTIRATDGDRGGRGDLIQAARGNENKHFKMWHTPSVPNGKKRQVGLEHQVRMTERGLWPTMTVVTALYPGRVKLKPGQQTSLSQEVHREAALYPTPTAQDAKNNAGPSQTERNTPPLNAVAGGAPPLQIGRAHV